MGINLKDLVHPKPLAIESLRGKKLAIDTFNILYQFLTAIRDRSGEPFKDSKGRVTSHIMGLFYRIANLIEAGAKPVFVFDGKPIELKQETSEKRSKIRDAAALLYEEAVEKGDLALARKYAQRASRVTKEIIESSKELLTLLGMPIVQAYHDGEAQASYMCKQGQVDAVVSQDWDCLLFGAPILIRNLTSSAEPQEIVLKDVLKELDLTQEQLVDAAVLIGTDFNAGVKGVGPKSAIKLAKEGVDGFDAVKDVFLKPKVVEVDLKWGRVDHDAATKFLLERGFSENRIKKTLDRIAPKQKGLAEFF
jgi:flap endonuclease-1